MNTGWYRWQGDTLLLDCYLKPGACEDGVFGLHDGRLRVRVTAAPVEGKANQALCRLLAAAFGTPKGRARLVHGATGRRKTVAIDRPGGEPAWFVELRREFPCSD